MSTLIHHIQLLFVYRMRQFQSQWRCLIPYYRDMCCATGKYHGLLFSERYAMEKMMEIPDRLRKCSESGNHCLTVSLETDLFVRFRAEWLAKTKFICWYLNAVRHHFKLECYIRVVHGSLFLDPTRPGPTHGSIRPMDNSVLYYNRVRYFKSGKTVN